MAAFADLNDWSWLSGMSANGRLGEVANGGFVDLPSQNLDLADWPLWRNATGSFGSFFYFQPP